MTDLNPEALERAARQIDPGFWEAFDEYVLRKEYSAEEAADALSKAERGQRSLSAARAAILAYREADGWQDINTAPKEGNGSTCYGKSGPNILATDGAWIGVVFWNGRSWDDGDWHDTIDGLTHWQPLPPPPETKP